LEWKLSSDNSQNPTWYKIENVTGASYTVGLLETLSANTRYHFRITAHADGFEDSQASLVVGETTKLNLV
ncbi:MAG: pectinacetylesterase family protein, partial [Planctomycetaceae bacterium]|nr:pectinacetylesterase family protein [Planctomycetaceae bacterium]